MANKVNSASRLHELMTAAYQLTEPGLQVYEVWARVAGIPETNSKRRMVRAIEVAEMMHDEMEHVRTSMSTLGYSEDLYAPHLKQLQDTVLYPGQFLGPWANLRGNMTTDALLALGFCAELLPNEEDKISEQQLSDLSAEIDALEASLDSPGIPPTLANLIRRQLERIRLAIAQYRVIGARALRTAARTTVLDIVDHKDEITGHQGSEQVSRLRNIIDGAIKFADGAIRADRFIEASNKIIALIDRM